MSIKTEGGIWMETERYSFIKWVKVHKKSLLLAGISVTAIIGVIFVPKNKDAIMDLWESFEKGITKIPEKLPEPLSEASVTPPAPEEIIPARKYTSPQEAYGVDQHIRNLSGGRHHSAEKAAGAAALGISLSPNQTLVDSYTKCVA